MIHGHVNAADFGFYASNGGPQNRLALQNALDQGGTVVITEPGVYDISNTVFIGSNTSLVCQNGVVLRKVTDEGGFCSVILNKGALTKTWDEHIEVIGLQIAVNGVDKRNSPIHGLIGQASFFYVRDLTVRGLRCLDIGKAQFGIHICTFEDVRVEDCILKGDKDGVHFGRGRRFTVRDCVFETYDDAVALNAHDYDVSNPELGWIEDGLVENCHDLDETGDRPRIGFFSRILAGAWLDWHEGIVVQKSDTVISNGRLYRVAADPDGKQYVSHTPPTHESGFAELDGINWLMVQDDVTYTAGVRNVTFRSIFLHRPRIAFAVHFDNDCWSRSYYPGAQIPLQQQLVFDDVRVLYEEHRPLLAIATPVDVLTVSNSSIRDNAAYFITNKAMPDYGKTALRFCNCVFNKDEPMDLIINEIEGKRVDVQTLGSTVVHDGFRVGIRGDASAMRINSDLPGLQ
ncbi:MAG: hypothetical protein IJC25_00310 [Clostridia bacterium]|nr:hypothetical protein [Clostridia bacterium]